MATAEREVFEIPIAIQDRSFTEDGALFDPETRAFFEGLDPPDADPVRARPGLRRPERRPADLEPRVLRQRDGGQPRPSLDVQQRRYRFRFLNGCNARFLRGPTSLR